MRWRRLLSGALPLALADRPRPLGFAVRLGRPRSASSTSSPDDEGRDAHLIGLGADEQRRHAIEQPTIETLDVLAARREVEAAV
jgi:hypothetical protein